jgi:hypothetical protein
MQACHNLGRLARNGSNLEHPNYAKHITMRRRALRGLETDGE